MLTRVEQQTTKLKVFNFLICSCLPKRMVLSLIMKTKKNFKLEKMLKFTQFCNFYRPLGKNQLFKKLQLMHVRLEIFLTFS